MHSHPGHSLGRHYFQYIISLSLIIPKLEVIGVYSEIGVFAFLGFEDDRWLSLLFDCKPFLEK